MTTDDQLIERIRASLNEEAAGLHPPVDLLERLQAHADPQPERRRRLPSSAGGVSAALASIAVVAIVVIAIASLGHRRSGSSGVSAVPVGTPAGARALVARMAVLRRPQTAADRLPESVTAQFPGALGADWRIIQSLTRLAATIDAGAGPLSSVDIYVVVETPCSGQAQGTCHGPGVPVNIVTTLAVGGPPGHRYLLGYPEVVDDQTAVATGGLTPTAVGSAGGARVEVRKTSTVSVPTGWSGVNVSVVPDGVTRVKWVFGGVSARFRVATSPPVTVYPEIKNNIAVAQAAGSVDLSTATWYGAGGQVIASLSPIAQQKAEQARALAASAREPIAAALVKHFAIFRRPVPPPATIEQPPERLAISAVRNYGYDQDNGYRLNVAQARFVPYPGTTGFWVIPGSRGVSMANGNGGNSVPLSGPGSALSGGMITTRCCASHEETVYGLIPDGNPTVTVVLAGGVTSTIPVIDNVYSITVTGRVISVIAKDAAGRRVGIRAPG